MSKPEIKIQILAAFLVTISIFSALMFPLLANAQAGAPGGPGFNTDPIKGGGGVATRIFGCTVTQGITCIIVRVLQSLAFVAFIVSVLFVVIGGFRYVAAQGNDEALETAKKTILRAVIGLIIIIASWVLLSIIVRVAQFGETRFFFF